MSDAEAYPWYVVGAFTDLRQGDLIVQCPLPEPDYETLANFVADPAFAGSSMPQTKLLFANVIVLTQSCDLANGKCERVVVCSYDDAAAFIPNKDKRNSIAKGLNVGLHMLESCKHAELSFGQLVVDFRQTYSLPIAYLQAVANARGVRARLLPPYREHLAQMFARYFMRVGLPVNMTVE